ncbi:MAG: transcriptional regulator [Thermodesulfobacteriota bacterium]|nr:transcriptional regulator [Thermodesulfobacteriota bacterium]
MEVEKTRRQYIITQLQQKRYSVYDLAKELRVNVGLILDDLDHIRKSVSSRYKMHIFPSECAECGFMFKKRSRLTTPSRCPICKKERISPPSVKIE